ncbi:hypothetical protein MPTK1_8g12710 [Marchantia polymorpha subsp. ruderalis]|uniref:Uncharacterized protein n=1 Tax=Marchantia polymorpha TaxID=3197 RepID=A0A2R6WJQ9_MARPO|nr:hypothetical protein MARPO_0083s0049 [Marchantia polymorpha]BBN19683.1 hypothetical protein Mp_8g12710 [Marchantia polymorpha subsp. ruderalis]|eukprot:PTQ34084.1 hypothetical protein MARPO_0083s0049 [Marchantia polymorpha]
MVKEEGVGRAASHESHQQSVRSSDLGELKVPVGCVHSGSVRESLTRQGEEKKGDVGEPGTWKLENFIRPASSMISAGLYLFDFVSNVLVLKEYYDMKAEGQFVEIVDFTAFAVCLGLMVVAHVLNVVAFKLKLPPEEHPVRSAYFLPIVQFRRVVTGIWNSRTLGRSIDSNDSESHKTEALYAIMCASMETGPQLGLQLCVMVSLGSVYPSWQPSCILKVSIGASVLSGAYNTGRAVMYHLSDRWTWTLNTFGLIGGTYTVGALVLRCTAIASVVLYLEVNVRKINYDKAIAVYFCLGVAPISLLNGVLALSKRDRFWSAGGQLHAWVAAYIGFTLGPLYPVVEGFARDRKSNGPSFLLHRLPVTLFMNFLLDVSTLGAITAMKWNACNFRQSSAFSDHPDQLSWAIQPALSSTFTCSSFLGYTFFGAGLSVISSCVFLALLATSSYASSVWDSPSHTSDR